MTAETVVINRTAVALAADSAVTLVSGNGAKATNNADKVFQLSHSDPVGIMIFGNSEFMSIPFEPIIKDFRNSLKCRTKNNLEEYASAFFDYLENDVSVGDEEAEIHIRASANSALQSVHRSAIDKLFSSKMKNKESLHDKFGDFLIIELESKIDEIKGKQDCESLRDFSIEDISAQYNDIFRDISLNFPLSLKPASKLHDRIADLSKLYISSFIKKEIFSGQSTGIAIAGFGAKDIFPSLYVFDTEGIYCKKLKKVRTERVLINSTDQMGYIASLAQDDVVKRYVEGIDPNIFSLIENSLDEMMKAFGASLAEDWFKGSKKKIASAQAVSAAKKAASNFILEIVRKATNKERNDITNVVHYMSKPELAQLAEALVEMTALRRRVSMDIETVGGPIDVAVISRGDGFVWIKRKHYFAQELNSRYFNTQATRSGRS